MITKIAYCNNQFIRVLSIPIEFVFMVIFLDNGKVVQHNLSKNSSDEKNLKSLYESNIK